MSRGRRLRIAAPIAVLFALSGCATTSGASSASIDAVRAFVVAESAFDAAVETADLAVRSGRLNTATEARIKAFAGTGHTYVVAGRAAVEAADAQDMASETTALTNLAAQLAALSKG